MRLNKKLIILTCIAFFLVAGSAYASSSTFLTQAKDYISDNCSQKHLSDQTSLLCYLFNKAQEQDTAINTINTTLTPIPSEINDLKNHQSQTAQSVSALQASVSATSNNFIPDKIINVCFNVANGQIRVLQGSSCFPDVRWQIPVKCFAGEPCKPDNPNDLYYLNNN